MINKQITKENCLEIGKEVALDGWAGSEKEQSIAWIIVYNWCLQNGMREFEREGLNQKGIERIISFLESKIQK